MKSTRRGFFAVLAAFLVAFRQDPEKLFSKPACGPTMIAGRELIVNPRVRMGSIDFVDLKAWVPRPISSVPVRVPFTIIPHPKENHTSW